MERNEILLCYGNDPMQMTQMLLEEAKLADRIPPNAKIGLKPNLVVANPAETGATTHPEILAGAIEYLFAHGQKDILILEGSWVGDDTDRAFRACGYSELAKRYGVRLFNTKKDSIVKKEYNGMQIEVCKAADELDFLINIPVLKGHCQTAVTGALKNLKGCISDREKRRFHTMGLHKPIASLGKVLKQHFILVDGICGDLDFEEGGNPVQMNRMFCALDPVLADSFICASMGYAPQEIEYVRLAAQYGVGSCDLDSAKITELNHDDSPTRPTSSRKVRRLARRAEERQACSACYANLIQAFARLEENGELDRLPQVCIGQGFRGQSGDLGVGACTAGMTCSLAGCPPKTPEILAFLRELGE